jgi:hypothetical protein
MEIIVVMVLYWTFAVACLAIFASINERYDGKTIAFCVGASFLWPLVAVIVLIALPYMALVASTKRIRVDLHNRKLLREFNEWLAARDKVTISPKE